MPGTVIERITGGIVVAVLGSLACWTTAAMAQAPAPGATISAPAGYFLHETVDLGGNMVNTVGSSAMYNTLVNLHSGPRVQGETFELRALPGHKGGPVDYLKAFTNGFGGDPNNFAKLDFNKGKLYDFSGTFRRDRQYFDYDLLGNPNIPGGQTIPIGPLAAPTGSLPYQQVNHSPFLFNTVRRMTDTNLTLFPLAKVLFRFGYSQNVFEGPSLSPSGDAAVGQELLLREYQRNSSDDFTASVEWKPLPETRVIYEQEVNHYKGDSFFTLNPASLIVQEADGTRVAPLASYDTLTAPYLTNKSCNSAAMLSTTQVLYPAQTTGGLPVVDPACFVVSSYLRTQPTREIFPTEILRVQSSSIHNVELNGDFRYTDANMNMPNYYENYQGLNGATRASSYYGNAKAERQALAADLGITWLATQKLSFSEQINYSNVHQPGRAAITGLSSLSVATGATETINNPTVTPSATAASIAGNPALGTPISNYFGQQFLTNNVTASWQATPRVKLALTYRYEQHIIAEGIPHSAALAAGAVSNGTVTINENGGILSAALHPRDNWTVNGTVELLYNDNVFTPLGARETEHYKLRTVYKLRPWATVSGAFNDLERHNNTNNIGGTPADGQLQHVDHNRSVSFGANLAPNEHYSVDLNYAYSDVYTSTNICYEAGTGIASGSNILTFPGAVPANGSLCPGATIRGTTPAQYEVGPVKDFMDAPTQSGSVALAVHPVEKLRSSIGYRISSVNGSQTFNDARAVNGSLVSTYQTPFVNAAWTVHKGWIWKGEYDFTGYGEGGVSGAQYCSTTNPTATSPIAPVLCSTLPNTARSGPAFGMTAPRNFHANNITLGMHYEF
jgi:hypothetical protein